MRELFFLDMRFVSPRCKFSVYLYIKSITYPYVLINILLSYFRKKMEEFYRKRVFLCSSTRFPASIGL